MKTPIPLVLNNARVQHCQLVQNLGSASGIELLFFPSSSPKPNLIERLWKSVKKNALNNRHHTHYADYQVRIDRCLNELSTKHTVAMATLLTQKVQTFGNVLLLSV